MIFTNINKFHEFWWVFEFRNNIYENEPKWEKPQAGLPPMEFRRALRDSWSWAQEQAKPKVS